MKSGTIDMAISGLNVEAADAPAIYVEAGATLNLTVEGENALTGGDGFAAICVESAYDADWNYDAADSVRLSISGDGTLTVTGGDGDPGDTFGGGAGIGGNGQDEDGNGVDFGSIEIASDFTGSIHAAGGDASESEFGGGAGIGGGGFNMDDYLWGNVVGQIEIHNGNIVASSNGNGAGIGGGGGQGDLDTATSNISIAITGGNIEATGGTLGAGIGGGGICDGGSITINGAAVTAMAGDSDGSMGAAGIGGGNDASVSSVIICGGAQVIARASGGAAGIGGGTNTSYSNVHYGDTDGQVSKAGVISIYGTGTTIYAYGGTGYGFSGDYGGAGIGSGYPTANNARSVAFDISITGGASVRAYGGYHAQAIGYGYRPGSSGMYYTGYGITLTLDDSIFLWAQNADYYQPALVANTAYDDAPISYSSTNDIYLTHYVDAEREPVNGAGSNEVSGYLNQPAAAADEIFDWAFDEDTDIVSIGPITVVDKVTGLNGNWATLCTVEPITIALADLIIYVGGDGYESVVTDEDGTPVQSESDGLPEPGFTVELPAAVDAALKAAAGYTGEGPLDLSDHLSFVYDDGTNIRSWSLARYDNKEGSTSIADGRYIYRIVPAEGQEPVRLQFTDENNETTVSDAFEIVLTDQYQVYEMTIYPGALEPEHLQAVVTFPDGSAQEFDLAVDPAELIIRGVVDEGDPTTAIVTTAPTSAVDNITAQVPADTLFYINQSTLEVQNWNAVKLLADHIIPAAQETLLVRALADFDSRLTEDYHYEFRYLDLIDTSNGNVWVTASEDITVYWPYPDGTDKSTEFFVVHYHDLDRQYEEDLTEKDYETTLYAADVQQGELTLENTDQGIKITVDSFSPFALFWTESGGGSNNPGSSTDPGTKPDPDPDNPEPEEPDIPVEPDGTEGTDEPVEPGASADPNTPEEPEQEPELPDDERTPDDVPQTNDISRYGFWAIVALCCAIGLGIVQLMKRHLTKRCRK